jgi:hypothetical protein
MAAAAGRRSREPRIAAPYHGAVESVARQLTRLLEGLASKPPIVVEAATEVQRERRPCAQDTYLESLRWRF